MADNIEIPKAEYVYTRPEDVHTFLVRMFSELTDFPEERILIETFADRRPTDGPYISIYFFRVKPLWDADPEWDEKLKQWIYQGETFYSVQVSFWGENAFSRAQGLQYLFNHNCRNYDLFSWLGGSAIDTVEDASMVTGGHVLQHAFFKMHFYAKMGTRVPHDWVSGLNVHLKVLRANMSHVYDNYRILIGRARHA